MGTPRASALVAALCLGALARPAAADPAPSGAVRWRLLQPGLRYAAIAVSPPPGVEEVADKTLYLVKLDAGRGGELRLGLASEGDRRARTAAEWSGRLGLAVTINLGMYQGDNLTHVGYLRRGAHVNSRRWVTRYDSLLSVDGPRAVILDRGLTRVEAPNRASLGAPSVASPAALRSLGAPSVASPAALVQNLRFIRSHDGKRGEATWGRGGRKRWSEAALGMDRDGNLLFIFTRVPFTMGELGRLLLALPLQLVRGMHLEGGPEASLSLHAGGLHLDLCGSFETGFFESDLNKRQFELPNVLGVTRR